MSRPRRVDVVLVVLGVAAFSLFVSIVFLGLARGIILFVGLYLVAAEIAERFPWLRRQFR